MFEETVWSLIPPLLAITLAIVTRQVFLALGLGIVSGAIMLEASFWPGMARSVELVVETLNDPSNAMVVLFTFVIGSLISSMESLGGIRGFVNWLEHSGWLKGERSVKVLVWLVGVLIFIESNITILVAGALARPLFDKFKISREKLAYLIDSTSAPICLVIPFNAWGAYIISILQTLGEPEPVSLFVRSILYNFYSLFAVFLALMTALFAFDLGPMKKAEARTRAGQLLSDGAQPMVDESLFAPPDETVTPSGWLMIAPILTLVFMMPMSLYITGLSEVANPATATAMDVIKSGQGAVSVLWSVLAALALLWIMSAFRSIGGGKGVGATLDELVRFSIKGAQGMLPLALIILMALTLGSVTKLLGTGAFVAQVASANMNYSIHHHRQQGLHWYYHLEIQSYFVHTVQRLESYMQ